MRKSLFATGLAVAVLMPSVCVAQETTGAAEGAAAGAAAAGPVGAIIGGIVGALAEPPAEVETYVLRERVPSVSVQERVGVGEPLPPRVKARTIPKHKNWRFAVVNNRRVIIDTKTRRVVKIVE